MLRRIWNPALYHGHGKRGVFFEGWYFKLISEDKNQRWAVIPGVFHHPDPTQAHAFIQVLNGMSSEVVYHRFPFDSFQASRTAFMIQIGENYFHRRGISLLISSKDQVIQGDIEFQELRPWPVRLLSPGVMGPYHFAPFMQTYHGVLSLDHQLNGSLLVNDSHINFAGGRGYIEKDWGNTFPRAYIWMQSNHFPEKEVSITASVATIPWLNSWFRGFLIGLLVKDKLYRFTTYLGSKITNLGVDDQYVTWQVSGTRRSDPDKTYPEYRLVIKASRGLGGLLSSPELDGMTPRILESLTAGIQIKLLAIDSEGNEVEILYEGEGDCGGLEVAGSIEEIIDDKDQI
jgi:hypothetical protein